MSSSDEEGLPLVNALRIADAARATAAGARALLSDDASDEDERPVGDAASKPKSPASKPKSPASKASPAKRKEEAKEDDATPVKPARKSVSPVPEWIKSATPSKPPKPATSSDESSDGKPLALKANALRAALGMEDEGGDGGEGDDAKDDARGEAKADAAAAVPAPAAASPPKARRGGAADATAAAATATEAKAATAADAAPPSHSTGIPLYVPDRLPASRFLVELEDAVEGGRMDLAGDAGVVGRLLVAGPSQKKGRGAAGSLFASSGNDSGDGGDARKPKEHEVRLDLKGRLYRATLVPVPSTLCVVNVQADAARVEAVSRCYLKLDAEAAPGDEEDDDVGERGGVGFEFDDDEEPWAIGGGGGNAANGASGDGGVGGGDDKKKRKKKAPSAFGGGGGAKAKAKAKPKKKPKKK